MSGHLDFIFHQAMLMEFSPVVTLDWAGKVQIIDLLNRLPADIWGLTPSQQSGVFAVRCAALPEVGSNGVSLTNWFPTGEGPKSPDDLEWFQRALAEAEGFWSRPILINQDQPFDVRQDGKVLCRWIAGDYQEGGPAWVAPDWNAPPRKRRPRPTGISVDEYEAMLRERLTEAGFDFRRPDRELACRVFLGCGWEPVACDQSSLYYEARDEGIEFGRWFQHTPDTGKAQDVRVALRFSSPKLRDYQFRDPMLLCGGPDDTQMFAKKLQKIFTGTERMVTRWRAEFRRYSLSVP